MSQCKPAEAAGSNRKRLPASDDDQQELKRKRTNEGCSSPVMGFDDLPDELIVKIFANLRTEDLLLKAARVSKRFCRLSQDPDAHVSVQFPELDDSLAEKAIGFLRGKNKIREVKMDFDSELSTALFKLAVIEQKVTTVLDLSDDKCISLAILKEHPEKAKQVRKLIFFSGEPITSIVPEFINLIEFEFTIDMEMYPKDKEASKFVSRVAMKSKMLEAFSSSNSLKSKQMQKLLNRHGKTLKKFHLTRSFSVPEIIIKQLISLPKIEDVMFQGSKLSKETVIELLQLEHLRAVEIHSLSFCQEILDQFVHLIHNPKFTNISLDGRHHNRFSETFLNCHGLYLDSFEGFVTPEVLKEFLRAAAERKDVECLQVGLEHKSKRYDGYNEPSTELRMVKGETFYLSTHSGFLPKEKLLEMTSCLASLPSMTTVEIAYDLPLTIEQVTELKRLLPGEPTVIAKVSI